VLAEPKTLQLCAEKLKLLIVHSLFQISKYCVRITYFRRQSNNWRSGNRSDIARKNYDVCKVWWISKSTADKFVWQSRWASHYTEKWSGTNFNSFVTCKFKVANNCVKPLYTLVAQFILAISWIYWCSFFKLGICVVVYVCVILLL